MSETVKVVCYKSKALKDGSHPLMVRVCKDGKKKYQSLGISILPSHWDFKKNEPNENCPNRDEIRMLIQQKLYELQKTILSKRIEGKDFTASSLLVSQSKQFQLHNNVEGCFNFYVRLLKEQGRLRYAGMYEVSHNSFIKYAGTLDIPFNEIDVVWLKKYESWMLKQGLAVNTIGTRNVHNRRFPANCPRNGAENETRHNGLASCRTGKPDNQEIRDTSLFEASSLLWIWS